ncbi:MAG: PTS sugar transporter subunit IIA [Bacillota bacterium]|nr:PTS sugar transporter subunit IIA [Bacillota bacterium]
MRLDREISASLQILIENNGYLTATDLIKFLGVPKSTAYDLLTACGAFLSDKGLTPHKPRSKRVIRLPLAELSEIKKILDNPVPEEYDYSISERRLYILLRLIEGKETKNHSVCDLFRISRNTCISDILAVNKKIAENGFNVLVSSSSNGYVLSGSEHEIRRIAFWAVTEMLYRNPLDSDCSMRMPGSHKYVLYGYDYVKLKKTAVDFSDAALNLSVHLGFQSCLVIACLDSISASRILKKRFLEPSEESDAKTFFHTDDNLKWILIKGKTAAALREFVLSDSSVGESDKEKIIGRENEELLRIAISAASLNEEYPEQYKCGGVSFESAAMELVSMFEIMSGSRFSDKRAASENLAGIITGVRLRTLFGYSFKNPGLEASRGGYRYICGLAGQAIDKLPSLKSFFTDKEKEYMAFQLIGLLLNDLTANPDGASNKWKPKKIGVICANSVGTGALIKQQLDVMFPNATVEVTPLNELSEGGTPRKYDLIVSTVDLGEKAMPYIKVHAFLSEADRNRIGSALSEGGSVSDLTEELVSEIEEEISNLVGRDVSAVVMDRMNQLFLKYNVKTFNKRGYMLNDLISLERIQCVDEVSDWEEALNLAAKPLIDDGSIEPKYIDAMIQMVNRYGPYFILAPGIALPHARPEDGVNKLAMSLLKVNKAVVFDEEHYANLFFVLASADGKTHLEALKQLSHLFMNDDAMQKFLAANNAQELWELLN